MILIKNGKNKIKNYQIKLNLLKINFRNSKNNLIISKKKNKILKINLIINKLNYKNIKNK